MTGYTQPTSTADNWNAFTNGIKTGTRTWSSFGQDAASVLSRHYGVNQEGRIVKYNGSTYVCTGGKWVPYGSQTSTRLYDKSMANKVY